MSLLKNEKGILFTIPIIIFALVLLVGLIVWALMDPISKILFVVVTLTLSIVGIVFITKKAKTLTPAGATAPFLTASGASVLAVTKVAPLSTVDAGEPMLLLMTLTAFAFIAAGITAAIVLKGRLYRSRGRRR